MGVEVLNSDMRTFRRTHVLECRASNRYQTEESLDGMPEFKTINSLDQIVSVSCIRAKAMHRRFDLAINRALYSLCALRALRRSRICGHRALVLDKKLRPPLRRSFQCNPTCLDI